MKVVGYRRLSPTGVPKAEQEKKLKKQKDKIVEHCLEEQHIDDRKELEIFTDKRVSGRKQDPVEREQFNEMLAYIIENDVDEVVAYSADRYTRNVDIGVAIHTYVNAVLKERDFDDEVRFYAILEDKYLDPVDGIGEAAERMVLFIKSQLEAEDTANKTQDALDDTIIKGRPPRGLTTDQEVLRAQDEEVGEATEWRPDTTGEFAADDVKNPITFYEAIDICNRVADGESKTAIGRDYGFPSGSEWDTVHRIWKNRHKYIMAAHWGEVDVDIDFEPPEDIRDEEAAVLRTMGYPEGKAGSVGASSV